MNSRNYLLLFLSFALFSCTAAVVLSQDSDSRIQVTGAIVIREASINHQAMLNSVQVDTASRILFTGALANRKTLLSYPSVLDTFILQSYIDRIIIQRALANRAVGLERPSFLPNIDVSSEPAVDISNLVTDTPTPTSTSTAPPVLTEALTTESIEPTITTPEGRDEFGSSSPENATLTVLPSPAPSLTLDNLNAPTDGDAIETPEAEATPSTPSTKTAPEILAALINTLGVIVAAVITAAVGYYIFLKEKEKGKK